HSTTAIYTLSLHDALPICDDGAGQRHPLALAAREVRRTVFAVAFETNHGKRLVDPAAPVGGRHLAAEDELEGLPHGHVRPEREVLEDHAHAARLGRNQYAAVAARRLVADQDHAPLGRLESGDQPQHGALARTRR